MTGPDAESRNKGKSEPRSPRRGSTAADHANRWSEYSNSKPRPDLLQHLYEEAKRVAEERSVKANASGHG